MPAPRIAVIIGSTRANRFADIPAQWILAQARAHGDLTAELVDLRDFDLPFFDEVASNLWTPSQSAAARRWQETIAGFDGYLFVTAEYNRSITGALKNALDQSYVEWNRKPMTVFAYGSMGGARAAEHLRSIAIELQMVPVRSGVHLGMADFFKVHPGLGGSGRIEDVAPNLLPAVKATFDDLAWWANATRAARASTAQLAA